MLFKSTNSKNTAENKEKFSSGKIGEVALAGINSPLFYRLNYARITGRMIYLNCVQVKEFVNGGKENLSGSEKRLLGVGKYKFVPGLPRATKAVRHIFVVVVLGVGR